MNVTGASNEAPVNFALRLENSQARGSRYRIRLAYVYRRSFRIQTWQDSSGHPSLPSSLRGPWSGMHLSISFLNPSYPHPYGWLTVNCRVHQESRDRLLRSESPSSSSGRRRPIHVSRASLTHPSNLSRTLSTWDLGSLYAGCLRRPSVWPRVLSASPVSVSTTERS